MLLTFAVPVLLAGCATVASREPSIPEVSIEPLEYYPGEVKGYQDSYPLVHILVLLPTDSRHPPVSKDVDYLNRTVPAGSVEVGAISDQTGAILQRIYSSPIEPVLRAALAYSAKEAGTVSALSDETLERALHRMDNDYILAGQITVCWVAKRRVYHPEFGTMWETEAKFAVDVQLYKPPFHVPFWEGGKAIDYYDPPLGYAGLGPDDPVAMYDRPGQVLSVAMTRTVAGIFANDDLRKLLLEDSSSHLRQSTSPAQK